MDVPQFIAGRFRIEREIGVGGMGTVYRASHLGLQRSVAVKIIKSEFAGNPDVADRFMREARTMAKLRHQRAAMIFDAGNLPDGRHFIIMEFIEGGTLAQQLGGLPQPFRPTAQLILTLARAIHVCHQNGIVHRDLKPSNILIALPQSRRSRAQRIVQEMGLDAPDFYVGTPKISDFGLAKQLDGDGCQTESGMVMGTIGLRCRRSTSSSNG